jgi:AcrR family transcriptional regulator
MSGRSQAPSGLTRRHARMSDEDTERRMLDAAVDAVNRAGLTVGLDHISYEDVIRDAGVSRSSAYRRWPYKDLFFADLLRELARAASPAAVASVRASVALIRGVLVEGGDLLASPEGRQDLLLEMIRQGADHDFGVLYASTEWRTYLALHATFLSIADAALRRELETELAGSEAAFIGRVASSWRVISGLVGYRLRPDGGITFADLATIVSASLRGHVLMALADPVLATRRFHGRACGATRSADWSPWAFDVASLAFACFEPDPEFVSGDEAVRRLLDALDGYGTSA